MRTATSRKAREAEKNLAMGRPGVRAKDIDHRHKEEVVQVRMRPELKQTVRWLAEADGISITGLITQLVNRAAIEARARLTGASPRP